MIDGETLETLIGFVGGFTEKAYTASIRVKQLTDKERRIQDITKQEFNRYQPRRDEIDIASILDRLENSVSIGGDVYRPGQFELTPGLTLSGLLPNADGVKGDLQILLLC